jgi:hypothetical protein
MNEGFGYCHDMPMTYERMLMAKQSSPSSRLGLEFHSSDARDLEDKTWYTIFLSVKGIPTRFMVECRTLCQMSIG